MPPPAKPTAPRLKKFTEADLAASPSDVTTSKILGRGNFSRVFLGTYKGTTVAVKEQEIESPELMKYLLNELAILAHVKHAGVIGYFGAFKTGETVHIITEYVEGGDLGRSMVDMCPWRG